MGPKFFHVVLYEYLRVFLNTPFKILHSKKWKKNVYGSKVVLSGEPSTNKKKSFKKIKYRTKNGSKNVIKNHFWFNKELFWFSFLEPFQEV